MEAKALLHRLIHAFDAPEPAPLPEPDEQLALGALMVRVALSDHHYELSEISKIDRLFGRLYGLKPIEAAKMRATSEKLEKQAPETDRFAIIIRETVSFDARVDALEASQRENSQQMDVVEARTAAIETTVKQELTERRDALVSEMRQLETLIERLSRSFETKLADAEVTGDVAPQDDAVLRRVKDALEDGRVDLHLQPIVSLPQRRVSFYEGFTRLRDPDGSLILPADFLDAARRANLLGVLDNMMLYRSVEVVRRLAARDRRVGVFCNVSSHSLEDPHFFPFFLNHMEQVGNFLGIVLKVGVHGDDHIAFSSLEPGVKCLGFPKVL